MRTGGKKGGFILGALFVAIAGAAASAYAQVDNAPVAVVPTAVATATPSIPGCSTLKPVNKAKQYIYKHSAPLRNPKTYAIVGYREEPTLICATSTCRKASASFYSIKGRRVMQCPHAEADGFYLRYRCSVKTKSLRRKLVAQTGSAEMVAKVSPTTCVHIPDAGKCFGSVKGNCDKPLR